MRIPMPSWITSDDLIKNGLGGYPFIDDLVLGRVIEVGLDQAPNAWAVAATPQPTPPPPPAPTHTELLAASNAWVDAHTKLDALPAAPDPPDVDIYAALRARLTTDRDAAWAVLIAGGLTGPL
jgi:hypothetical protein